MIIHPHKVTIHPHKVTIHPHKVIIHPHKVTIHSHNHSHFLVAVRVFSNQVEASLVESCEGEDEMGAERGVHVFRVVLHGLQPVVGPPRYVAHCPVLVMPA